MRIGKLFKIVVLLSFLVLAVTSSFAQTAPPNIFFTDLTSGPNSGGENVSGYAGAYVTLYGNNFGTAAPTVTLNGASCLRVVGTPTNYLWYQKLAVQLGSSCAPGNFIVTTSAGSSNPQQFTVRSGNIYFVSTTGNDAGTGSFSSPWATIQHAVTTMAIGGITYVGNGVVQSSGTTGNSESLDITGINGTAATPYAIVAYPGATATIGKTGNSRGFYIGYLSSGCGSSAPSSYWTIAGFLIQNLSGGTSEAFHVCQGSSYMRIVGNKFNCQAAGDLTGCVTSDGSNNTQFWGNEGTTPASGSSKTYHTFYWGDDSSGTLNVNQDIGWNYIHDAVGGRGILFHSQDGLSGREGYNISVHDNLIYNIQSDGINFANTNPNKGYVVAYNNVIYHVGTGPDQSADYACLYAYDSNGTPTVPVQVYNNTCYDGGPVGVSQGDSGAWAFAQPFEMVSNVTYELSNEAYLSTDVTNHYLSMLTGSNNLWYGLGNGPTQTTGNVNSNPDMVSPASPTYNFNLQNGSPAIGAGIASWTGGTSPTYDHNGLIRPNPPSVGAYEFTSGVSVTKPNPPTNLQITVQ